MFPLPPNPGWEGLHPLVIHFPISLLLVAPAFIIIGMIFRRHARGFFMAGFILVLLGTVSAFVAVQSGKAAGELAERTPEISAVLERHEDLAETTVTVFSVLALYYALLLFGPSLLKKELSRKFYAAAYIVFLLSYAAGSAVLVNTAHNGGRLVHEYGVHSMMGDSQPDAGSDKN